MEHGEPLVSSRLPERVAGGMKKWLQKEHIEKRLRKDNKPSLGCTKSEVSVGSRADRTAWWVGSKDLETVRTACM